MNKKLTAKVQEINPKITKESRGFAKTLVITPDSESMRRKKGTLYVVYNINSPHPLDTQLVEQITKDVLHDTYYQTENISPTQSLEKAIAEVKTKLANLTQGNTKETPKLHIIGGILWGNALYIVRHGEATGTITRSGLSKEVNFINEGSFSAASGIIRNDDVVILNTNTFAQAYPPDKLFSATPASFNNLSETASCIMLKFVVENTSIEEDIPSLSLKKMGGKNLRETFQKTMTTLKQKLKGKRKSPQQLKTARGFTIGPKKMSGVLPKETKQKLSKAALPLLVLAFAFSLGVTIIRRQKTAPQEPSEGAPETTSTTPEEKTSTEPEEGTEIIQPEVFYDIKIADQSTNPTEIAVTDDSVVVVDKTAGKIYTSKIDTIEFTLEEKTFPQISSLTTDDKLLTFTDNAGYKIYNLDTKTVEEEYALENPGITETYLGFVYEIKEGVLTKHVREEGNLEGSIWAQHADFENAKDLAISINIYVLKGDNTIAKYTSGKKETFEISGTNTTLENPIQLITNLDMDNIYIADKADKSVAILTKEGGFVKRLKTAQPDQWNDIRSIGVTPDEEKLFVLSGSKIFEVNL